MSSSNKKRYTGEDRKLVVAIDIGTTFSAVSLSILQPGEVPQFEQILEWPKQVTTDAKVPSVVMYDASGEAVVFGAATLDDASLADAGDELIKCEWFKLHLRPPHLPLIEGLSLSSLPSGKTVDDVLTDFLGYIWEQLMIYIKTHYAEGGTIWTTLSRTMEVILTTPNGWELEQQQRMRTAAIRAGLIADEQSGHRVRFVSEAEAAILYAVDSGNISGWMTPGSHIVLCDGGGGTIDITSYKIVSTNPLCLEETTAAKCYLAGSVFVTEAFKKYLIATLKDSEWDQDDIIADAVEHFDRNGKRKFEDPSQTTYVGLGGSKTNLQLGIQRGKLKIPGSQVAKFFERSLVEIKRGLSDVTQESNQQANRVVMVGGLLGSSYLYKQIQTWAATQGMEVSRPDGPTTKAVANGALAWSLDNAVSARINKFHYGIEVLVVHNPRDAAQAGRAVIRRLEGIDYVDGFWGSIVSQGTKVQDGEVYSEPFNTEVSASLLDVNRTWTLYAYRLAQPPSVLKSPNGVVAAGFEAVCTIKGDLQPLLRESTVRVSPTGSMYYNLVFDICISFGATELSARMRWKQGAVDVYGPATIVYIPRAPEAT